MKKNDLFEIKKMDLKSIREKAKKIVEEITDLHMDKNMGKLTNMKVIKSKRRDLAQTLTVLKQKELLQALEKPNENKK